MPDKFTVDEYNKMTLNMLPRIERWGFRMQKWMLHHLGFLSKGMRVGLKYGFDSGMSLDYVYRNQAQGCGPIGRWIDKGYLNAIGWRGVRIRREHLIATVEERIETLKQRNEPVKILDIAGGTGNYLFDIKRKFRNRSGYKRLFGSKYCFRRGTDTTARTSKYTVYSS